MIMGDVVVPGGNKLMLGGCMSLGHIQGYFMPQFLNQIQIQ